MKLSEYKVIFWDFDGVIKDSLEIKTESFKNLFKKESLEFIERVGRHHIYNGGISRYEKIPLYLSWLNKNTDKNVEKYLIRFKNMTVQKVIESDWVEGVENFINQNSISQNYYIVTGTPQDEIKIILEEINLIKNFKGYFGSPSKKEDIISLILSEKKYNPSECIMIGDATADYDAAKANKINFLLRKHKDNQDIFINYQGLQVTNFLA